jgi:hypothetical protein
MHAEEITANLLDKRIGPDRYFILANLLHSTNSLMKILFAISESPLEGTFGYENV